MELFMVVILDPEEIPEEVATEILAMLRKSKQVMYNRKLGHQIVGNTVQIFRAKAACSKERREIV